MERDVDLRYVFKRRARVAAFEIDRRDRGEGAFQPVPVRDDPPVDVSEQGPVDKGSENRCGRLHIKTAGGVESDPSRLRVRHRPVVPGPNPGG